MEDVYTSSNRLEKPKRVSCVHREYNKEAEPEVKVVQKRSTTMEERHHLAFVVQIPCRGSLRLGPLLSRACPERTSNLQLLCWLLDRRVRANHRGLGLIRYSTEGPNTALHHCLACCQGHRWPLQLELG